MHALFGGRNASDGRQQHGEEEDQPRSSSFASMFVSFSSFRQSWVQQTTLAPLTPFSTIPSRPPYHPSKCGLSSATARPLLSFAVLLFCSTKYYLSFPHNALRRLGRSTLPIWRDARCSYPIEGVQGQLPCRPRYRVRPQQRHLWSTSHDLLRPIPPTGCPVPHLHSLLGHSSDQPVHPQLYPAPRPGQV